MKKLLIIFAASILGMVACNEERVDQTLIQQMESISAPAGHLAAFDCCDGGNKCYVLPDVIIEPGMRATIDAAIIGGPTLVNALFIQPEYAALVEGINADYLEFLQTGNAHLSLNFESETEVAFYVGEDFNSNETNALFAFKVAK